jgi:hypothetical protein
MSKLPNLTLRLETPASKKKVIKSKQFHSSFQRAPCLTVHLNLPTPALIPHVTLTIDQRQSSGLFGKEYTVYHISTIMKVGLLLHNRRESESSPHLEQLLSFVQCRRYSDFVTLHANLQKKFPRNIIPPLPPKVSTTPPSSGSKHQPSSSSGGGNEKALLESRRRWLSLWLQYILLNGAFQRCDLVKEFVAPGDPVASRPPGLVWETGPSPDTLLPGDFVDDDEVVSNRHSSVDSKSGIAPPPSSTVDVINEAAYYKCTQETHTVLR